MGEIVNLRQARKAKSRRSAAEAAAQNRARHGSSKAQRDASRAENARARRELENLRREKPDGEGQAAAIPAED